MHNIHSNVQCKLLLFVDRFNVIYDNMEIDVDGESGGNFCTFHR